MDELILCSGITSGSYTVYSTINLRSESLDVCGNDLYSVAICDDITRSLSEGYMLNTGP